MNGCSRSFRGAASATARSPARTLVAGTNEDQAEGKGGKRHDVHGNGLVRDDGDEELLHLFFWQPAYADQGP